MTSLNLGGAALPAPPGGEVDPPDDGPESTSPFPRERSRGGWSRTGPVWPASAPASPEGDSRRLRRGRFAGVTGTGTGAAGEDHPAA